MLAQRLTAMGSASRTKRNTGLPASPASRLAGVRVCKQRTERPEDRDLPNVASGKTSPLGCQAASPGKTDPQPSFSRPATSPCDNMSGWILWRESVPEVEGFGIIGDPTRENSCDGQTAHLQRSGEFRSIRGNSVSRPQPPRNFGVSAQVGVNATREPAGKTCDCGTGGGVPGWDLQSW